MKKLEVPEVTQKSTKEQILSAYNEVLAKLAEKVVEVPQEQKRQQEARAMIDKVSNVSKDDLLTQLSHIKLKSIKQIDVLSEDLLAEYQKLNDVRQAISLEQTHLEELYQIKETAHTLAALIRTHQEKVEAFKIEEEQKKLAYEKAIAEQRQHWKEENERLEKEFAESKEKLTLQRTRENEDYLYNLELKRRQESDVYAQGKATLEKELIVLREELEAREKQVAQKEAEFASFKDQVITFPEQLEKAVAEAENAIKEKLEAQFAYDIKLKEAEAASGLKINEYTIKSLQGKIAEQDQMIKMLTQKADQASNQVQSIASKALETSAKRLYAVGGSEDK
ncbi:MAG: hypothetical protein KBB83_01370 [Alphaproteobacteria bacterium]|nr:hypothetical protein [Alphaproteobacteria bacterium]